MKCDFYDCTSKATHKIYYEGVKEEFTTCKKHLSFMKDALIRYVISKFYKNKYNIFSGKTAFELSSTYGCPLYLTRLRCEENNLFLDELEYVVEMRKHKEKSRKVKNG